VFLFCRWSEDRATASRLLLEHFHPF
jgi:hypothetical protein